MLGTHHMKKAQKLHFKKLVNLESLRIDLSQISWQNWPSTECVVLRIEYVESSQVNFYLKIAKKSL